MYYCFKEVECGVDDTPYDDSDTDAYVAEYEASLPPGDIDSVEILPEFDDSVLFEGLED